MTTLERAPLNKKMIVKNIIHEANELGPIESRLLHLGFIENEPVVLLHKAPYFQIPILVEIKGRRIALSLDEAKKIQVEEAP